MILVSWLYGHSYTFMFLSPVHILFVHHPQLKDIQHVLCLSFCNITVISHAVHLLTLQSWVYQSLCWGSCINSVDVSSSITRSCDAWQSASSSWLGQRNSGTLASFPDCFFSNWTLGRKKAIACIYCMGESVHASNLTSYFYALISTSFYGSTVTGIMISNF